MHRQTAILLAFLSGAPALGLQILWVKTLSVGLGREYPSVISSSTAFLGGMALGACLWHLWRRPRPDPLRLFVFLECLSAAWMIVLVVLAPAFQQHFPLWMGFDPSPARHWAVALAVPFLFMLPVSLGQGIGILLIKSALETDRQNRPFLSGLYAANTAGALAGLWSTTFLLLPHLGCRKTSWILAALNVATALIGWTCCLSTKTRPSELQSPKSAPQPTVKPTLVPSALGVLFLTGFLGVGYQMLVVRSLSRILENTVFTFTTTLAVYVGFSALGAAWHHKRQGLNAPQHPPIDALAALMVSAFYGVTALSFVNHEYHALRSLFGDASVSVIAAETVTVSTVCGPVCFCMGFLLCNLWNQQTRSSEPTQATAALYAANLLGSAVGPAFIGLFLLKLTGIKTALLMVSAAYYFLAPWPRLWSWKSGVVLLASVVAAVTPFETPTAREKILASIEGPAANASVLESQNGHRMLRVNQRFQMGGTGAVIPQRRQAHIPLLLHPKPRSALFLGMGTGITFAAAAVHPNLSGDSVELLPEVARLRPYFEPYSNLPQSPDFRVFISDARRFILAIDKTYDVIVADLFHPGLDGSGGLYTREHFQAVKAHLAPDGLFCQWIPMYQMDEKTFKCIVRTFLAIFPEADAVMLRFAVDAPVVGLVGGKFPMLEEGWVEARLAHPPLAEQLRSLSLADTLRLQGCHLADAAALQALTVGSPINTDDNQWITFHAPEFSFQQSATPHGRFIRLLQQVPSVSQAVTSTAARGFIEARNVYLNGLVLESQKEIAEALRAYVASARMSRDFTLGYAQCLSLIPLLAQAQPQLAREILHALVAARPEQTIAKDLLKRMGETAR